MTVADPSSETTDNASPETDVSALPNASETDATAASSTATETGADTSVTDSGGEGEGAKPDATKPKSVFEAAKAALKKDKGADPSPADANSQQPKDGKPKQPAQATETAEADNGIPKEFSKHPAWIRIAKDRDAAKEDATKWQRFNELVQAGGYGDTQGVESWLNGGTVLNRAGVSADERNLLLEFGVAAKTNPVRAMEIVKPIYEALQGVLGEGALPADLQAEVDSGAMTEDHARRIARSEASTRIEGQRRTQTETRQQAEREAQANSNAAQAQATAVVAWEARMAKTDPDWSRISDMVAEHVGLLRDARKPRTPEEAVKVCEDAVKYVKRAAGLASNTGRAQTVTPRTANATTASESRPKTVFEAAQRALSAQR